MTAKTATRITWILSGLLAFAFFGAGITKLIGVEMQLQNLQSWGYPLWMRFPIGIGEIALAIGLVLPTYRKWIIYGIYGWGLVAIFTHLQATPPQYDMLGGPVVFLLLNTALLYVSSAKSTH